MAKTVEVDEVDFLRNEKLRETIATIAKHPEGRLLMEQAHRLVNPNAPAPALEAKKAVEAPLSAVEKKIDDFIKAQNEANEQRAAEAKRTELKNRIDSGIATLRQRGWTDEGIKQVEALMEEKGLLDPLDAADLYEKRNPPPVPTTPSGGAWNFPEIPKDGGDAYEKALLDSKGGNDMIVEREAMKVLNEIRGGRRN